MGVAGVDPVMLEPRLPVPREKQIDHPLAGYVASLDQHRGRPGLEQGLAGAPLARLAVDREPGQSLGLRRIGGEQPGAGNQQAAQGLQGRALKKRLAALGDHHRIDHRRDACGLVEDPRHGFHRIDASEHSGLDGVRADVREHCAGLGLHHLGGDLVYGLDAQGVLHRHRGDRRRRIAAQRGDGLDIGLDPRAAAGVRAGDDQHPSDPPGRTLAHGGLVPHRAAPANGT